MRYLLLVIFCAIFSARPALADWPTTEFAPIPPVGGWEEREDLIDDGFSEYTTGAETALNFSFDEMTVETLDMNALMSPAFTAYNAILNDLSYDARKLAAQGFAAPLIEPIINVTSTGKKFYSLFWVHSESFSAPMRAGCSEIPLVGNRGFIRHVVDVNNMMFSRDLMKNSWDADGYRRQYMRDYTSATFLHEVVHAVQRASFTDGSCTDADPRKWFLEGTADGIAYYLLSKRRPEVMNDYAFPRNERRYDVSLNRGFTNEYTYGSGSFFRYLMEASETGDQDGLPIMKALFSLPLQTVASSSELTKGIDGVLRNRTGGRGLYLIFPEFLTEFASYGEGRYEIDYPVPQNAASMSHEIWLNRVFDGCREFNLIPGATTFAQNVEVKPLAGECLKVTWTDIKIPVALQIFATGAEEKYGDLHLGEAVRTPSSGAKYCYDATKGLSNRLNLKARQKCILRRDTSEVTGVGDGGTVAVWTSDFNVQDSGEVYLILSNVAAQPAETDTVSVDVLIGAIEPMSEGEQIRPRKTPEETAVNGGLTDIDQRVHAMSGNETRWLTDGRTVANGTIGNMPTGFSGAGDPRDGVMTLVRGENYWLGFIGAGPSGRARNDGIMIIKNPGVFEASLSGTGGFNGLSGMQMLNAMRGVAISGGIMGEFPDVNKCGYDITPTLEVQEKKFEHLRYRIEADLFDFTRAMSGGNPGSECEMVSRAFVERANFTVTLPYGPIYDGNSQVKHGMPEGQELYDGVEFLDGPNFGGIETSLSLAMLSDADEASASVDAASNGTGGTVITQCNCSCPDAATPDTSECRLECVSILQTCKQTSAQPKQSLASPMEKFESLLDTSALTPDFKKMLLEDFLSMSPAVQTMLANQN